MSYSTVPTKNTGDTLTAAEFNQYVRDNFAAGVPDIFEAAGDLAVGNGVDAAVRLAKGSEGQLLKIASGAVAWGSLLAARQGGDASAWAVGGSNNYTPTQVSVQVGAVSVSLSSGSGSFSVTFPNTFGTGGPLVWLFVSGPAGAAPWFEVTTRSTTTLAVTVHHGTTSGSVTVYWLAIGPTA